MSALEARGYDAVAVDYPPDLEAAMAELSKTVQCLHPALIYGYKTDSLGALDAVVDLLR